MRRNGHLPVSRIMHASLATFDLRAPSTEPPSSSLGGRSSYLLAQVSLAFSGGWVGSLNRRSGAARA